MRFSSLAALFLAGCFASGVGVQEGAIVGGTNDSGDPSVVLLLIGDPNGGSIAICTGEVISAHVVLTAGHCTTGRGPFNVYFGNDINQLRPSDLHSATAHTYPQYKGQADNYDIGLFVLDKPVPDGILPLPFNRTTNPSTLVGQPVRLVGFGTTGSVSPTDTTGGIKRVTNTTLSGSLSRVIEFDDTRHNTCEGDSGGPAFATIDGVETIIGVTSVGGQANGRCQGQSLDSRVDLYVDDFIQPFLTMYDPPLAPKPGEPGATGSNCNIDDECFSKNCTGQNGYCTADCDAAQADSCPPGLACQLVGDPATNYHLCARTDPQRAGGCSVGGGPSSLGWLLLLPLLLLRRRRFSN
jgi:V8-like Glu-specific endopeptidase